MKRITTNNKWLLLLLILFISVSCEDNYQPKLRGYFRIKLPEQKYQMFSKPDFPYSFMMSKSAVVTQPKIQPEKYWIDISYPNFKAKIHISYKQIDGNLGLLLNDMHRMMNRHIPKANAINEQVYVDEDAHVSGMVYEIKGSEAASPYQFYLTDSTKNFVRGALYFEFTPNNDSLKPIIRFLEEDMRQLINTFNWENTSSE